MGRDGDLRRIFRTRLPDGFWTSVETGLTGAGVPDAHYIFAGGASGWCEFKLARSSGVRLRPEQVAWLSRHARMGGRCFVITRVVQGDLLYVHRGADAGLLRAGGLAAARPLGRWSGGPGAWDWAAVRGIITRPPSP